MEYIIGTAVELQAELITAMARYRQRVFVETLGWDLKTRDGLEFDQFDRPDTRYVIALEEDGSISGVARLLPTTDDYLLAEVFPQLMGNQPLPQAPDVWELSRFAAVDFSSTDRTPAQQVSSPTAIGLLKAVQNFALRQGIRALVTVSPLGIERLLRKAGFQARRAAPPVIVDGHPLFACWIDVPVSHSAAGRRVQEQDLQLVAS